MPVVTRSQTRAIREEAKAYAELFSKQKSAYDKMINISTKYLRPAKVTNTIGNYELYNYVLELSPIIDDALMNLHKFPLRSSYNFVGGLYNTLIRLTKAAETLNIETYRIQFIRDFAQKMYNYLNATTVLQFNGDRIQCITINTLVVYPTA
jgi:hypothetical protein